MLKSMTGFGTLKGSDGAASWSWDLRAVNARGLDIRLRLPDWIEGLEPLVRKAIKEVVARGSLNLTLRVSLEKQGETSGLNAQGLNGALDLLAGIEKAAHARGLGLAPVNGADIAAMRGVLDSTAPAQGSAELRKALAAQLPELLASFDAMRRNEGQALAEVLSDQLSQVATLVGEAENLLDARAQAQALALRASLSRLLDNADGLDEARLTQELALIATKTDIREELDRLAAHVTAARALLGEGGPVGRKLDFLMQEFNREANTLCSKAQFGELTRVGLDLKHVIDQMREQVQNVE